MSILRPFRERVAPEQIGLAMTDSIFRHRLNSGVSVVLSYRELVDLLTVAAKLARKHPGEK